MGFIPRLEVRQDEVDLPLVGKPSMLPIPVQTPVQIPVQTQAPTPTSRAPIVIDTRPTSATAIVATSTPTISRVPNPTSTMDSGNPAYVPQPGASNQGENAPAKDPASIPPETASDMAGGSTVSSDRAAAIGGSIVAVVIFLILLFLLFKYRERIMLFFRFKRQDPEEPSFADMLERQTTRLSRYEDRCGATSVFDDRPQTASTVQDLRMHYSFATSVPTLAESSAATSQQSLAPSSYHSGNQHMTLPPLPPQKPREVRYRLPLYHMEDDSYDNIALDPYERLEPPSANATSGPILRPGPCRTPSSASAKDGAAVALAWWQASGTCESPKARYSYLEAKKWAPVPVTPELRTPSRAEVCDDRTMSIASSNSGVMIEEGSSVMGTRSPSARSDRPSSVFSQRSESFVSAASSFENYRREAREVPAVDETETAEETDNDIYGDDHEDLDFEMLTEGDSTVIAVATTSARSSIQEIDVTSSKSLSRAQTQTLSGGESPSHCAHLIHSKDRGPVVELQAVEPEHTKEDESEESKHATIDMEEYEAGDDGYESSVIEEGYEAVPSSRPQADKLPAEQPREKEWSPEVLETIRESRELLRPMTRESFLPEISLKEKSFEFGFP